MNDPESFEHVATRYRDNGGDKGVTVYMQFRGRNAFGGKVLNSCLAMVSPFDGEVLDFQLIEALD